MKPASQRDIAFVFQMFALYPHMNVRKNISYPLVSQGMPKAEVKKKVTEVAKNTRYSRHSEQTGWWPVRRRPSARRAGSGHCSRTKGVLHG